MVETLVLCSEVGSDHTAMVHVYSSFEADSVSDFYGQGVRSDTVMIEDEIYEMNGHNNQHVGFCINERSRIQHVVWRLLLVSLKSSYF